MPGCIIVGTGPGWRDELDAVLEEHPGCDVVAVNHAGMLYLEQITHWVSLHANLFRDWFPAREAAGGNMDFLGHGHTPEVPEGVKVWHVGGEWRNGSSALFALLIMTELMPEIDRPRYNRVILCGVPMEGHETEHIDELAPSKGPTSGYQCYRPAWERRLDQLRASTRSTSGWTREVLGEPPPGWLDGS